MIGSPPADAATKAQANASIPGGGQVASPCKTTLSSALAGGTHLTVHQLPTLALQLLGTPTTGGKRAEPPPASEKDEGADERSRKRWKGVSKGEPTVREEAAHGRGLEDPPSHNHKPTSS